MPYIRNEVFENEIMKEDLGHEPLIEEFIFKNTINMIYAKPGVGKSVITANIAAAIASQNMVFGYLKSNIQRVVYLQTEGSRDEQFGRLQSMQTFYGKLSGQRISWHNTTIAIENMQTWSVLLKELNEVKPFDLFIIDPIYGMTSLGLVNEKFCINLKLFNEKIRNEFGCSILMSHHTPKDYQNYKGEKVEKDTPMGMQWIEASLDGMYYVKRNASNEVELECKKNRSGSLIQKIALKFNITNWTLQIIEGKSDVKTYQKIRNYLINKFDNNSFTTTNEICQNCGISKRHLRRLKNDGFFDDITDFATALDGEITWIKKI